MIFFVFLLWVTSAVYGMDADMLTEAEKAFRTSQYAEAEGLYKKIFAPSPLEAMGENTQLLRAKINYAETLLARGKYKEGHELFDARLSNTALNREPLQKPWDGSCQNENCAPLLIRGEHGIGDTFFFMRYLKQLHDLGIPVIVRERGFLKPLLSRQSYIKGVVTSKNDEEKTAYKADVYSMSLPRYVSHHGLRPVQKPDDIVFSAGYIEPRTDLVEKWRASFAQKNTVHVLIGAYRASKNIAGECRYLQRDCAISALIKHLAMPGVVLYHPCGGEHRPISRSEYERLKKDGKLGALDEMDIVEDSDMHKVVLLDGDFDKTAGAFEDTAAAMCASDYVVTVDTSTAMLAGGLGSNVKNVAVLLPKESDWRWGEGQPVTTPFFANTRLFWQKEQGDWSMPLAALQETIKEAVEAKE